MTGVGAVVFPVPPVDVMYHKRLLPPAVSEVAVLPRQKDIGDTVGDARVVLTTTSICARGPSQVPVVALTQYEVVPTVAVLGVGAVVVLVPPTACVYHFKLAPVAVNGTAVTFWQ